MAEPIETEPTRSRGRRIDDQELAAIHDVLEALQPLDEAARQRVVAYVQARYAPGPITTCCQ